MSLLKLILRSLCFYWRTNLTVLLSAVVTVAVLTGALLVGDSVRYSLRVAVGARLGNTKFALVSPPAFFRSVLADDLADELSATVAPLLQVRGVITNSDGSRRANTVQVIGVDDSFYRLGDCRNIFSEHAAGGVVLNTALARKLNIQPGQEIILRMANPSLVPRDAAIGSDEDLSIALRTTVLALADESAFGRFSLQANQAWPLNVFVPLEWLQSRLNRSGQANVLLLGELGPRTLGLEDVSRAVVQRWRLADIGLQLRRLDQQKCFQIHSRRIFLSETLAQAAVEAADSSLPLLSYFVNELRVGGRTTPYSIVTALGRSDSELGGIIPAGMKDNEIVINNWLADDLQAKVDDIIELTYYVAGPMRKLIQHKRSFVIRRIVPLTGLAADREFMPAFPGLSEVDNCRDWQPGIPIDLDNIRSQDEDYWNKHKGTPKAFVTLQAGQDMWRNRFGNLTAVRYPFAADPEQIAENLLAAVEPASIGLFFQPVRQEAVSAADQATDFGQLFLGFSFFLIAAAAVLMGLIFTFGAESRVHQLGVLMAMGFSGKLTKCLLLLEGTILAVLGALGGTIAGTFCTRALIAGLSTVWQSSIGSSTIQFHAQPSTLLSGGLIGVAISITALWLALGRKLRRPAHELLAGYPQWQFLRASKVSAGRLGLILACVAGAGAVILLAIMAGSGAREVAAFFFGSGALLLLAGLGLSHWLLSRLTGRLNRPAESLLGLSLRNMARRRGRSLTVVWLFACGVFLVVAVGANRHDSAANAAHRHSGTGGFGLFGESAVSILHDLNRPEVRDKLGLDERAFSEVDIVQLRSHDGDEASCLNLNRPARPRLLGVDPQRLQDKDAFLFTGAAEGAEKDSRWEILNHDLGPDIVPAVGDSATITWALGKSLGDKIDYTDQSGNRFSVLLAGMIDSSVLQGSLVISEEHFRRRFPSDEGYRTFLIDVPMQQQGTVMESLGRAAGDFGLELTPAPERLARFMAVENTYLSIFQLLGGLGLVLGSAGVGLVVLRNALDRRGELAMLRAVGFEVKSLKRMVFYEHGAMFSAGLLMGLASALLAVAPVLISPGRQFPHLSLFLTVAAILASGIIWIYLAATLAMKGPMLQALRNE